MVRSMRPSIARDILFSLTIGLAAGRAGSGILAPAAGNGSDGYGELVFTHVCRVTLTAESADPTVQVHQEAAVSLGIDPDLGTFPYDGRLPRCRSEFDAMYPRG